MRLSVTCCAVLALAGPAVGQPYDPRQAVFVPPSPIHRAPDSPDSPETQGVTPLTGQAPPSPPSAPPLRAMPAQAPLPPPPADMGPRVAIARSVVDAAGAFESYMRRSALIDAKFADGASVARALETKSAYEPRQLEEGAIAYAALAALQDPMFVQVVHDVGETPRAREAFVARLLEHPERVLDAGAARHAAARVSAMLGEMGQKLVAAGVSVRQGAYDLQSEPWSRQADAGAEELLTRIKTVSATPVSLGPEDAAQLIGGLAALRSRPAERLQEGGETSPVVTQGLALAALAILGKAGEDQEANIARLLTDARNAQCLKLAKLNELQCLAVAGPHYEHVFCLGRHAMIEPGVCIATAAGMGVAELGPLLDERSVYVPIALTEPQGSERDAVTASPRPDNIAVPLAPPPPGATPYGGPATR